jgi:hypothetical protein
LGNHHDNAYAQSFGWLIAAAQNTEINRTVK